MSNNIKKFYRFFKDNMKLDLTYNGLISQCEIYNILEEMNNKKEKDKLILSDPLLGFIENYDNIDSILAKKDINIFEYLYLNRVRIHKVLYEDDENISITSEMMTKFSDYYYLYFLIRDEDTLNYKYEFELISKLYEILIAEESSIKKIIYAKILLCFIKNYIEIEGEDNDDKCKDIENKCRDFINSEKNRLNEFNINLDLDKLDDDNIEIDDIYTNIIMSLIKNNKLNNSSETLELLKELDIKNIRINKKMFTNLKDFLIEDNLKQYIINKYLDLLNEEVIMFYRMLFIYIFKSSDYIYYIPYLLELRKKIIELIKSNIQVFNSDLRRGKNQDNIIMLKEVLSYFIEQDYYIEQSKKVRENEKKLMSINNSKQSQGFNSNTPSNTGPVDNYSNSDYNSSSAKNPFDGSSYQKKDENNPNSYEFNNDVQEKKDIAEEPAYQILSKSTFDLVLEHKKGQKFANITYKSIKYDGNEKTKNEKNGEIDEINDIKSISPDDETLKINYQKFIGFLENIESELKLGYKSEKQINIEINFSLKNSYIVNNSNYYMICNYNINDENLDEDNFVDEDFLNNTEHVGLHYLIDALQNNY